MAEEELFLHLHFFVLLNLTRQERPLMKKTPDSDTITNSIASIS